MNTAKQAALAAYINAGGTYPNGFAISGLYVGDFVARYARYAPPGYRVDYGRSTPGDAIRIGQYKARVGDPAFMIFLAPTDATESAGAA